MNNIWLTSDLHMCHDRDFVWKVRGFNNVEEMNEALVENWNKVVKPGDIVYNLGDIALMDTQKATEYLNRLNGKQIWILGNHDHRGRVRDICNACNNITVSRDTYDTTLQCGNNIAHLNHYPMLTANNDEHKPFNRHVICFHGHTHQKNNWMIPGLPFMYHVGLDSHNNTPINLDEAMTDIRNKWDSLKTDVPVIDFNNLSKMPIGK